MFTVTHTPKAVAEQIIVSTEESALSDAELHVALGECLARVGREWRKLADIVAELERRGIAVDLPATIVSRLRDVSTGRVSADFMTHFEGLPMCAAGRVLPIAVQDRLAAGERIPMVVMAATGPSTIQANPADMSPAQVAQVVDRLGKRIRNEAQQRLYLEDQIRSAKLAAESRPERMVALKTPELLLEQPVVTAIERLARKLGKTLSEIVSDALNERFRPK